jgi:GTP cyclohydrolase I
MDHQKIEQGVRLILEGIGEDPEREGLRETPARVARAYEEICAGMDADPSRELEVTFDADYHDMICVRDIEFHSLCEHHLLPFFGTASIVYVPGADGRVCGLSKLARVVDDIARRPQLQERLTRQIADSIESVLAPSGVFVIVRAEHLCMTMRGVRKPGAQTVTSAARGIFQSDPIKLESAMALESADSKWK